MKRRQKYIIYIILILVFIGYISFRIVLNDDFSISYGKSINMNEKKIDKMVTDVSSKESAIDNIEQYDHEIVGNGIKNHRPFFELPKKVTREQRIAWFLERYSLNWNTKLAEGESVWSIAENWVKYRYLYPENSPMLSAVLKHLNSAPIVAADVGYKGTQLKITLLLEGNQLVVFKPKWYSRDHLFDIDDPPYSGHDRHNAEVAAFHLNRLLNFSRVPIVVGRTIDLETEIKPVAKKRLLKTFFERNGNTCFYGRCYYCKGPEDGVCGDGTRMEGTIVLWLPKNYTLKNWKHPWRRSYREGIKRRWETDDSFCKIVENEWPYNLPPRLLDIIDTSVLDFLTSNADRHHYDTFAASNESMLIMIDNGKGFGNPYRDELSILAPLTQCCKLRKRTYDRLISLNESVLSQVLKIIMELEPLSPVLTDVHLLAIDRRLSIIIEKTDFCIKQFGERQVLVNDNF